MGISVERISWQSDQVSDSISAFMISVLESVAIVLALLAVTMGWRGRDHHRHQRARVPDPGLVHRHG